MGSSTDVELANAIVAALRQVAGGAGIEPAGPSLTQVIDAAVTGAARDAAAAGDHVGRAARMLASRGPAAAFVERLDPAGDRDAVRILQLWMATQRGAGPLHAVGALLRGGALLGTAGDDGEQIRLLGRGTALEWGYNIFSSAAPARLQAAATAPERSLVGSPPAAALGR